MHTPDDQRRCTLPQRCRSERRAGAGALWVPAGRLPTATNCPHAHTHSHTHTKPRTAIRKGCWKSNYRLHPHKHVHANKNVHTQTPTHEDTHTQEKQFRMQHLTAPPEALHQHIRAIGVVRQPHYGVVINKAQVSRQLREREGRGRRVNGAAHSRSPSHSPFPGHTGSPSSPSLAHGSSRHHLLSKCPRAQ